jgi:outer membrane protein insertion porin family
MDKDQKRLLAYYRSLGFFKAHIGVEPTYNEKGNGVTITHVINEGPRFKIRNVSVVGNTQYSSEELMADMKLKSSDYFDQSKADVDRRLIADKYGSIGYVYADVRPDNLLLEQPGSMDVVYTIKEGSRYRVGRIDIDIKGDCPHTQVYTVLNQLAFKPGDIVDTRKIRESEMRLKSSDLIGVNGEHYSTVKIAWAPVAAQEPDQTEANLNVCIFAVP